MSRPGSGPALPPSQRPLGRGWFAAFGVTCVVTVAAVTLVLLGRGEGAVRAGPQTASVASEPVASRALDHLPEDCDLAVHLDATRLLAAPVARLHIAPALDELLGSGGRGAGLDGDALMVALRAAGVELANVGDAALCVSWADAAPSEARVAIVLGGRFPPGTVAPLVAATDDAWPALELDGRMVARVHTNARGLLVGQAADGALVVSTDGPLFEGAVAPPTRPERLAQAHEAGASLSFSVAPGVFQRTGTPEQVLGEHTGDVMGATGTLRLDSGAASLQLSTRDDDAARAIAAALAAMLAGHRETGPGAVLGAFTVRAQGASVRLEGTWNGDQLDAAAGAVAAALRQGGAVAQATP